MIFPGSFHRLVLATLVLSAVIGKGPPEAARADETGAAETSHSLRFRRVFVPADRVEEWPIGAERYVPVEPEEFERLVEAARRAGDNVAPARAARAIEARYAARLDGGAVIRGEALLSIQAAEMGSSLLMLGRCGLAVDDVHWSDRDEAVQWGVKTDGELGLVVAQSGDLQMDWTLRGRTDAAGSVRFEFRVPRCAVSMMTLDLPLDRRLVVDGGTIASQEPSGDALRRWTIALDSNRPIRLDVIHTTDAPRDERLALVRQRLAYTLSPRGAEVNATFELDIHYEPLRQLELLLDPGLRLIEAVYGEQRLAWSIGDEAEHGEQRLLLETPTPLAGTGRLIQLSAIAEPVIGSTWALPRVMPQGVFWQEGSATLRVHKPLQLHHLDLIDCRQTAVVPLAGQTRGEAIELQLFSAGATVRTTLAQVERPLLVATGAVVELDTADTTSESVHVLRIDEGARFAVRADVAPQWTVDSVESIPAGALADWRVDGDVADGQRLRVDLQHPVTPDEPLRLAVTSRRVPSVLNNAVQADELRLVRFADARHETQLVDVRAADTYQLDWSGAERTQWIEPSALSADERLLFLDAPRRPLLRLDHESEAFAVALAAQRPRFDCVVRADAAVSVDTLSESYLIQCRPEAAAPGELLLRFSVPREIAPRWSWGADGDEPVPARRLTNEELAVRDLPAGGEVWRLVLPSTSGSFTIHGSRQSPRTSAEAAVSMLGVLGANRQEGTVIIRALDDVRFDIEYNHLQPLPTEKATPDRFSTARATLAYDPAQDTDPAAPPALVIRSDNDSLPQAGAIAWSAQLTTWAEDRGTAWHRATYWLENSGLKSVRIEFPPFAQPRGVWVDQKLVALDDAQRVVTVELPRGERFPTLIAECSVEGRHLGFLGHVRAPLPELRDVPVLSRRWTLWLPPSHVPFDVTAGWQAAGGRERGVVERLFGVLARPGRGNRTRPFDVSTWSSAAATTVGSMRTRVPTDQFLHALGSASSRAETAANRRVALGELLTRAERPLRDWGLRLLVDVPGLGDRGIGPDTVVGWSTDDSPRLRALALLEQNGLVLVSIADADVLLLTTAESAAQHAGDLSVLHRSAVYQVVGGGLQAALLAAVRGPSGQWLSVTAWRQPQRAPWALQAAGGRPGDGQALAGWRAYRFAEAPSEGNYRLPTAFVFRQRSATICGWVALFLSGILAWQFANRWPRMLLATSAVGGIGALWLQTPFALIASGVLLGVLLGLFAAAMDRLNRPPSRSADSARYAVSAASLVFAPLALLIVHAGERVSATENDAPQNSRPMRAAEVLIPVDQSQQPTGDRYQLPESFYRELNRRSAQAVAGPRDWLLESGEYYIRLEHEPVVGRAMRVSAFTAAYDLYAFGRSVVVRVPLERFGANLVPGSARLDGRAVNVEWDDAGRHLMVTVDQAGHHRLELSLRPTVTLDGTQRSIDLGVPPLPSARVELELPDEAPPVGLPTVLGWIERDQSSRRVRARLGPSERLRLIWEDEPALPSSDGPPDVEQFTWLRVKPGSVVLEAHLRYALGDAAADHFELVGDPRLRLLPLEPTELPLAQVRNVAGNPQTWHLHLEHDVTGDVVVKATALLTGTSGVGNLRLPRFEPHGARVVSKRLAVSVDPTLDYEIDGGTPLDQAAVEQLVERWGRPADMPSAVFDLEPGSTDWTLATQPSKTQTTADARLILSFDGRGADVLYEADLQTTAGSTFQYRIDMPAEMTIQRIALLEERADRVTRWSRDPGGTVTVFLGGATTGNQQLSIVGRLPSPSAVKFPLPAITLRDIDVRSTEVAVFRRDDVQVHVDPLEGLEPASQAVGVTATSPHGRRVAHFRASSDYAAGVTLTANEPHVRAVQVTVLTREGATWLAEVDYRLQVDEGVVDTLAFEIPDAWRGPFDLLPAAEASVVKSPIAQTRRLVVRPSMAISDQFRLVIRGPIDPPPGERVGAPNVIPLGIENVVRYVVLPTQIELEQIGWETRGLAPAPLPEPFRSSAIAARAYEAYRVGAEEFDARLYSVDRVTGVAQVRVADVHVALDRGGQCLGLASFDVEPAGNVHCRLQMPAGATLVQAWVGGLPALGRLRPAGLWEIYLGPGDLPQRVDVVFRTPVAMTGGIRPSCDFEIPRLAGLPVERTLWNVHYPVQFVSPTAEDAAAAEALRLELIRLKVVDDLINQVSAADFEVLPQEAAVWYEPWVRRLVASRRRIEQLQLTAPAALRRQAEAEIGLVDEDQAAIAQRLGTAAILRRTIADAPTRQQPHELFSLIAGQGAETLLATTQGGRERFELRATDTRSAERRHRLVASLLILSLAVGAMFGLSRIDLLAWLRRWPQPIVVGFGLVWWLWLAPGFVGFLLVVVGLAWAARLAWSSPGTAGSTTIPRIESAST